MAYEQLIGGGVSTEEFNNMTFDQIRLFIDRRQERRAEETRGVKSVMAVAVVGS